MGRFQDIIKGFRKESKKIWDALGEDIEESKEYRFEGVLSEAMKIQEGQEGELNRLLSSWHHEDKKSKEEFKVNSIDNMRVEAKREKVNNIQEIEDNEDRSR